eukprot:gene12424-biopygen10991
MGPIGTERVYPRCCGVSFKQPWASFGGQHTLGQTASGMASFYLTGALTDAQVERYGFIPKCFKSVTNGHRAGSTGRPGGAGPGRAGRSNRRSGGEWEYFFCTHPCVPSMRPIGSERVFLRRCGASFKPLL